MEFVPYDVLVVADLDGFKSASLKRSGGVAAWPAIWQSAGEDCRPAYRSAFVRQARVQGFPRGWAQQANGTCLGLPSGD